MRKALIVGIDFYESIPSLSGCVHDARSVEAVLTRHADGTMNFPTPQVMTASNEATDQLNDVAAEVAAEHDVIVADGATPMRGTTGATTHMLDATPDIHPNSVGYDLLAQALVDVLP